MSTNPRLPDSQSVQLTLPAPGVINANQRQYSAQFLAQLADETNRCHGVPVLLEHGGVRPAIPEIQNVAGVMRNVLSSGAELHAEIVCLEAGQQADLLDRLLRSMAELPPGSVQFVPNVVQRGNAAAINAVYVRTVPTPVP